MDDPLRPKTVPLSAETVLWFEFLLDPSLLTAYLTKSENAGPTPIDLINQFLSISPESQAIPIDILPSPEIFEPIEAFNQISRKQLALKILGLKVASHLKWNLEIFEKNLPLQKQVQLLSDLCTVTSGKYVILPMSMVQQECQVGPEGNKRAFNFALTLYHRWVLRAQVLKELPARAIRPGFGHILATPEQANSFRDEMFVASLEPFTQTSLDFLQQILKDDDSFISLTFDSFVALNSRSDRITHNFDISIPISRTELKTQICFDLCIYYLHAKNYDLARENAISCRHNLAELKKEYLPKDSKEFIFCTLDENELYGCLMACGVADKVVGLMHRLSVSMLKQYSGITDILHEDNYLDEIPLVNRRILELDIEGSLGRQVPLPKNLLVEVAALNAIKSVLEDHNLFSFNDFLQKHRQQNGLTVMVEYTAKLLPMLAPVKSNKLKQFFLNILLTSADWKHDAEIIGKTRLFSDLELVDLKNQRAGDDVIVLPTITPDWIMRDSKIPRLEVGAMKRQLIECSDANEVRKLLVQLAGTNPSKPLWTLNPSWSIPVPLQSIIMSVQRIFLQDFAYILVGKAKEMAGKNDFSGAIGMLSVLKSECHRSDLQNIASVSKLAKLLDWEILLIQMCHTLEDWPKPRYDNQLMIKNCKQCLQSMHSGDNIVPRMEILDYCAAMLLNLNEWSALQSPDKRFPSIELCAAFANAAIESENFKAKKVCRDAWDLILPMFLSNASKRGGGSGGGGGGTGNQGGGSRDSPILVVSTNLSPFLKRLRNVSIITVALSLLARLHNILKDDSNMELVTEHLSLWPASISNATAYSIRTVSETLANLIKQALSYYPQHIPWIRLNGELEFVNDNNEAAMACYVNVLLTGTEYCTLHLQRPALDDHIVKRMIKACLNLGCNMQAAILCQFQEEIDYVLAFKCISEKTTFKNIGDKSANFCDAMDAYYNCIWDPTLLEFIIQQHSKKGEHKRKQQAVAIMGHLELNANNNEEIKREAASIRRTRFLRALAKQYML